MGIKITSTTCPNCGANLPIEEGRNQMFCSYCGTSIVITNENEHIYRVVDEADVIHEETEQMVQLRRIELEEQRLQMEQQRMQSREKSKAKTTKIRVFFGIIAAITGLIGLNSMSTILLVTAAISLAICIKLGEDSSSDGNTVDANNKAKIPYGISDYEDKNYVVISEMFRTSGFTNVKYVPLNDLTTGLLSKPGTVESIMINGKAVSAGGRKVDADSAVVISYHSFR